MESRKKEQKGEGFNLLLQHFISKKKRSGASIVNCFHLGNVGGTWGSLRLISAQSVDLKPLSKLRN